MEEQNNGSTPVIKFRVFIGKEKYMKDIMWIDGQKRLNDLKKMIKSTTKGIEKFLFDNLHYIK